MSTIVAMADAAQTVKTIGEWFPRLVLAAAVVLGLIVLVKILHAVGSVLTAIGKAVAVLVLLVTGVWWLLAHTVGVVRRFWRTSAAVAAMIGAASMVGWVALLIVAVVGGVGLMVWWHESPAVFDQRVGFRIRSWCLRWKLYHRKFPTWAKACGLAVADAPINATAQIGGDALVVPKVVAVRSGPSWDEVRVRLVPGLIPEDFEQRARHLAVARGAARCVVREIDNKTISLDFQRKDLLARTVACREFERDTAGVGIDLRKVWAGVTEYGTDHHIKLLGSHQLVGGETGAGKASWMWSPIVSVAPAIRDGLVQMHGIDPKGVELAFGAEVFTTYTDSVKDALAFLDGMCDLMEDRKKSIRGLARRVTIGSDCPLHLIEFDEIATWTAYNSDTSTKAKINQRVGLLLTQGRALGFCLRGYVQDPTKENVPFRELFPDRVALRVATESQVEMLLGDAAVKRGAYAHRIPNLEATAGQGYVFGEGVTQPFRVRAGWVDDPTIKALERYVTSVDADVVTLPASSSADSHAA